MGYRDLGADESPFVKRRLGQIFQGKTNGNPYTQGIQEATSGLFKFDPNESIKTIDNNPKPAPTSALNPTTSALDMPDMSMFDQGSASKAYRAHLDRMPNREDYQPGIMGRIGAALAGGAAGWKDPMEGVKVGKTLHDMKYNNAIDNYSMQGAGLKEAADLENQDMDNKMKYINDYRTRAIAQAKQADDARNTTSLIAQREAEVNDLKNKNWRETYNENGELILVHPDGTTKNFGKTDKTTELGLREREVKATESRAETYRTKPSGSINFVSPEQQYQSEAMAAQEVVRENPQYSGWVKKDGTLVDPSSMFFSYGAGGEDAYKDFLRKIKQKQSRIMNQRRGGMGNFNFDELPE